MTKPRSLRRRLTLGYAGIALLTVAVLGLVLAVTLPPFFAEIEREYLRAAAADSVNQLEKAGGVGPGNTAALQRSITAIAEANRVRLRVIDPGGRTLADSGSSADSGQVSDLLRQEPFRNRDGRIVARIEVSEAPKAGAGLTASIIWAWAIAGTLAVAVSAAFGYFLAGRVSRPITDLTRVSGEMAQGDLSTRADVSGDAEVRILATAFNEMADSIEGTFGSLRRFIGDAAHEIGTPLTALQADLELARESPYDPGVTALLDQSLEHTERIRRLTRDLLALSRLESVGAVAETERVDLGELAEAVIDSVASRSEQADVEVAFDERVAGLVVIGDRVALSQALENLLDNALKFTPAGGAVSVTVDRDAAWAVLRVSDTGRGIPPEDLPHVFERFHRARNAAAVSGSGLGLSIVKAIVDAHGGGVRVSSGELGTTIELRIPAAD